MLFLLLGIAMMGVVVLLGLRQLDHRVDRAEMNRLCALQPGVPGRFTADMVAGLPEPARRFFIYSIAEGTPLYTVAKITMTGRFGMGSKAAPNYRPMKARQVLAAPHGFVWKMSAGSGLSHMSGSDSGAWTRFWWDGLIPIARFGKSSDHVRSAFGRYVAEAAVWTPAALLPGTGTVWTPIDENTARYAMAHCGVTQSVDVTVDAQGRPTRVAFQRWSNANPDGVYRLQPFGAYLSEMAEFDGFRLPTHIEAGNHFGTDEYFPFFIVDVTSIRFPAPPVPED